MHDITLIKMFDLISSALICNEYICFHILLDVASVPCIKKKKKKCFHSIWQEGKVIQYLLTLDYIKDSHSYAIRIFDYFVIHNGESIVFNFKRITHFNDKSLYASQSLTHVTLYLWRIRHRIFDTYDTVSFLLIHGPAVCVFSLKAACKRNNPVTWSAVILWQPSEAHKPAHRWDDGALTATRQTKYCCSSGPYSGKRLPPVSAS